MRILWTYLKPFRHLVWLALLLAAAAQLLTLVDPLIFGKIIDDYAGSPAKVPEDRLVREVLFWLGLAVVIALLARAARAFQDYVMRLAVQKFGMQIFNDGLKQTLRLPYHEFEDQRSGETLSVLQKVRTDTERFINSFINILFSSVVGIGFLVWYAVTKHWALIPVFLVGVVVLGSLTGLLSRKIKTIQRSVVRETNKMSGAITESLRNIELVKSLGLTYPEIKRLRLHTHKIFVLEMDKVRRIRTLSFLQGTALNLLRQSILFVLLWLIFRHVLSTGELISMQFISTTIFGPLQDLGNIILQYREAEASLHNFDALMRKPVEYRPEVPVPVGAIKHLEFKEVYFKHKTAGHYALEDINFSAEQGQTIAFVGPSGSGKSTLVKLLVGLYLPEKGEIFYNDISTKDLRFNEARRQTGFVTQETQLFSGSIRDNLLFVRPDAGEEQMLAALQQAQCNNLLQRSGKGLDTIIGEGGMKLSGGEKQRLAIARALLREPRLMIFDEATSALDSLTEDAVSETIREVSSSGEMITIMIAHRLSTILHADLIYVLEKGRIVETGTHDALLEQKGLYYAMWRQQIGERRPSGNVEF